MGFVPHLVQDLGHRDQVGTPGQLSLTTNSVWVIFWENHGIRLISKKTRADNDPLCVVLANMGSRIQAERPIP